MRRNEVLVAATCAAGLGLVMTDNTAVTIALPRMGEDLGVSVAGMQWVLAVMVLATAASLPASGALGDRVGARAVYRAGLLAFLAGAAVAVVGSALAGLVGLLAGRAVQGVGAALMLPNGAALLGANIEPARRSRAVATWITLGSLGLVVGPLAGGWLVEHAGWRAVFALEAGPALFGAVAAGRQDDGPRHGRAGFDVAGALVGSLAVGGLCLGTVELGRSGGRASLAALALLVSALAGAAFVPTERRAVRPAIDITLFRNRRYTALMAACALYNAVIGGQSLLLSLLVQGGRGGSASTAGFVLLAATALMPLGSQVTGRLVARTGLRMLMASAVAGLAAAYVLAGVLGAGPLGYVAAVLTLSGMAAGMLFAGDTLAVLRLVAPDRVSSGLATLSLVRQCGTVLGVAVLGAVGDLAGRELGSTLDGLRVGITAAGLAALPAAVLLARHLLGRPTLDPKRSDD